MTQEQLAEGRMIAAVLPKIYYVNEDLETWQVTEEDILAAQRIVLELGACAEED